MMRHKGKGFTIVELLVTITILLILTSLVVTRLLFTEAGGRDKEREIDISAIATGLETYYQDGSPDGSVPKGHYPGYNEVNTAAMTTPPFKTFLDGVPEISYQGPDKTPNTTTFDASDVAGSNPDGSYTDAEARDQLYFFPYLYQPLARANTACFDYTYCVKFNLYYLNESTDTVIKIGSKNQ